MERVFLFPFPYGFREIATGPREVDHLMVLVGSTAENASFKVSGISEKVRFLQTQEVYHKYLSPLRIIVLF